MVQSQPAGVTRVVCGKQKSRRMDIDTAASSGENWYMLTPARTTVRTHGHREAVRVWVTSCAGSTRRSSSSEKAAYDVKSLSASSLAIGDPIYACGGVNG